jgi:hypothetical protein
MARQQYGNASPTLPLERKIRWVVFACFLASIAVTVVV